MCTIKNCGNYKGKVKDNWSNISDISFSSANASLLPVVTLQQYHTTHGDIQVTGRARVTLAYLRVHLVHQLAGILRAALAEAHAGQGLQGVHAVGAYRESRLHLRFTLRLGVLFVTAPGFSKN
jgi:hypothetical protein